ncbi:MAG TPA: methyltransferase domain-containing protein [Armatimonadota bacterium]|nr:methyltransferase domain-containing protein [Armatimonadota bacterium]
MKRRMNFLLRRVMGSVSRFYLSFGSSKACPICGWTGHRFMIRKNPVKPAPSHICPSCGSSERHRFAFLALIGRFSARCEKLLHFAPEKCLEPWLRSISKEYVSADLCAPSAMLHMDICNLGLADNDFTAIWCSHVLEHIENDRKAMSELFRVLRPGGCAVIMVPVYGDNTCENPEIKAPRERLKHFRQEDHVRLYGLDITHRLGDVGFRVTTISTSGISDDQVSKYQLEYPSTREIFLCEKE